MCRPATQGEGREQGGRVVRRVQGALRSAQVGAGTEGGGAALLEELCGQYHAVTRHSSSHGKDFHYRPASPTMINVEDNVLRRRFRAEGPNQKWVTDITYIWVNGRWLYPATVMDLYSRTIVGWKPDTSMTEKLAMDALSMAFANRNVQLGLIIHSDRGVQFRSVKYLDMIRSRDCLPSMSRQGNCWDNAVMESFYSRLKVELIYAEQYASNEAVQSGIFEYIEIFYNRKRRHSALGSISPAEFERRCA